MGETPKGEGVFRRFKALSQQKQRKSADEDAGFGRCGDLKTDAKPVLRPQASEVHPKS